jgi:hypothetical protein
MTKTVTRKQVNPKRPKTKLGLSHLDHSRSAVLDSLRSPKSKRGYRHAIDEFIQDEEPSAPHSCHSFLAKGHQHLPIGVGLEPLSCS